MFSADSSLSKFSTTVSTSVTSSVSSLKRIDNRFNYLALGLYFLYSTSNLGLTGLESWGGGGGGADTNLHDSRRRRENP